MILREALTLKAYILILLFLTVEIEAWAQDPQFSQFYANPIYTNPAFAGSSKVGRFVINARNQWPSISGAFRTGSFSYDEHFDNINGGIGVQATYDEQGVGTLRTTGITLMYSYQIAINRRLTMRASVQAGYMQKTIDFNKLLWYDQIVLTQGFIRPTSEPNGNNAVNITNFAAGIVTYTKNFYAGMAVHNIFEPEQDFYSGIGNNIPRRYTANVGLVIPVVESRHESRQVNIYPNVIVKSQRQFNQLNIGLYASKGNFVGGLYFRQNTVNADAFIFLIGIRAKAIKVGYSYDATVSTARTGAVNSHELSVAFEIKKRVPKVVIRKLTCPDY